MIFVINYRRSNVGGVRNVSGRYFESKGSSVIDDGSLCEQQKTLDFSRVRRIWMAPRFQKVRNQYGVPEALF